MLDSVCTPDKVASEVLGLIERPEVLAGMERALEGVGTRDAATVLARQTLLVAGFRGGGALMPLIPILPLAEIPEVERPRRRALRRHRRLRHEQCRHRADAARRRGERQ